MKAVVYTEYGSPDVLKYGEIQKPTVKDDEILVKVHAASVNPLDWHHMRGEPFLVRFQDGLRKPKNPMLGADVAGRVEAVGSNVKLFRPGDEVFGDLFECGLGAFAEYVSVPENVPFVLKPTATTFAQAAAVPVAAVTALQGLRDKGQLQHGQRVLINGASGGVGTFSVQIAKAFGGEVTGVCSTRNLEMVRSIGADHAIDYTQEDFTRNGQHYDLIIDNVGNRSLADFQRALTPKGICVIIGFTSLPLLFQAMFLGPLISRTGGRQIGLMGTVKSNKKDLAFMNELLESGKVTSVIDRRYSLREVPEAIRYLEEGHARGKVVITLDENN
jgi:NADPH:quinone reductase-like Zn-dependent oxidoreductase